MAVLKWDEIGQRRFSTGVDRAVLYFHDGRVIPWSGLTSVEDQSVMSLESFYLDGVKYLQRVNPGDFSANLKALTYPKEFDELVGVLPVFDGLSYHNQMPKPFNLCYRTLIGNDTDGIDHGYRIHILYNLIAVPDSAGYQTLNETVTPTEFGWTLTGTPEFIQGYRPTVHISIDSTEVDPARLLGIEEVLYGTSTEEPSLPDIEAFTEQFLAEGTLVITDNGDGTWTAQDPSDVYITMLDATTFSIEGADATYLDADTYEISTTIPE